MKTEAEIRAAAKALWESYGPLMPMPTSFTPASFSGLSYWFDASNPGHVEAYRRTGAIGWYDGRPDAGPVWDPPRTVTQTNDRSGRTNS